MLGPAQHELTYDLLVLGGGTAGLVGAKTAAGFGARVLLVERDRTGGDCLWTGCVPSKALLAAASAAASARSAARLGIRVEGVQVDFAAVLAHVHAARAAIAPTDSAPALAAAGVEVRQGEGVLTGSTTATVDGRPVAFRQALLATGASPSVPDLPGLREARPLTSESVWDLEVLPRRLAVLGGGSIGCELGQAFARLGAEVTLIEADSRLLSKEDPRASAAVEAALRADGVHIRTGSAVASVHAPGGAGTLRLQDGSEIGFDRLLVATGRVPSTTGNGLDAAGVQVDARGFVVVDDSLRTTNRRIWAAGDLTGYPQFTHTAGVHGSLAASNAVLGLRRTVDPVTPRVTFTQPEVASVGTATREAAGLRVLTWSHEEVDRAVAEGHTGGFTSLVVDSRSRVIGATVVGPRAGETLGELTLAVRRGLRTRALAGTTHAYPTYNDAVWNAAVADVREALRSGATGGVVSALAAVRRRWLDTAQRLSR